VGKSVESLTADLAESASATGGRASPESGTERTFARLLADVVGVEWVSVESHFFDDLGADSLTMARFCARVRKQPDLPSVSMKDIYQHPTVRTLATALTDATLTPVERAFTETLAEVVGIERVSVESHFFDDLGADSLTMARFCARVRKQPSLPPVSMKDIYQHPTVRTLATALTDAGHTPVAVAVAVERTFAELLADIVGVERVLVESHFFDDLGADSLTMARFCARVRKQPDLPPVSMKDIYQHPTVRTLATALTDAAPVGVAPAVPTPAESSASAQASASTDVAAPVSTPQFVLCGLLQLLIALGYFSVAALTFERGFNWISAGSGVVDTYLRSVLFSGAAFLAMCALPILAKWVLIGRWKRQQIRIWSLAYVRFWVVKTLVSSNPLVLFAGSPLYTLYLRALGAKVGRRALIFSRHLPVCTDLLTIGDDTVILKDSFLTTYRAQAGMIRTGSVTIGKDVFVGERAVLDIETSMGDGTQLGNASSLHAGQSVPDGERWHGSPGQRTEADYRGVESAHNVSTLRRVTYSILQLVNTLFVYLPLVLGGVAILFAEIPWLGALLQPGPMAFTSWSFYGLALATSLAVFFGGLLVMALFVFTVPRVLNLALKPDKVYRLYGIHYSLQRTIARMTNRKVFHKLTGDSSFIAHYLRLLGWKLSPLVQTGSNFGNEVKHENPYLSAIGSGTQAASDLSMINAHFSSTSFRVSRAAIGTRNFLGNQIVYPSQGRTGDNCLLATKVLVPVDGKVREGVGLLGSPSFEIPRTVERDAKFRHLATGDAMRRGLRAKNRHNLVSVGLFLLARWFYFFILTLIGFTLADLSFSAWATVLSEALILVFSVLYFSLIERASTGFRGSRPTYCSIYEIEFWRTERFFKLQAGVALHRLSNGTPLKPMLYRLVGVRVGRRLFDDGSGMSEKNMVTIGDDVVLNAGSFIQCHSQEDYAFKSDCITIGSGCTVGVSAMVHYGVTMGDGAVLAPDSFLMKGEEMPAGAYWGGNPAGELRDNPAQALARPVTGGSRTDTDSNIGSGSNR
jgi:non-ribosomal peptide synthetase-like protein